MARGLLHRSSRRLVAAACLLGGLAGRAEAQPASASHEAALSEFRQARRLIDAGDCAQALPHLEEALAYEPSIGARLSVAECVEKTDPLRAWRSLSDATLLAYASQDDRMPIIEKRLEDLERSLPLVNVALTRSDLERAGLEVLIDGRSIDRYHLRRNIAVEPGAHVIEIRAAGKATWSQTLTAPPAGTALRVPVTLLDRPNAPAAESASKRPEVVTVVRTDPRATRRSVGLALGATGIAAIATGAVFGILALGKAEELDDACGGSRDTCKTRPELTTPIRDNGSTLAAVSTVSFVVGGAALVSGVALLLWPGGAAPTASRVRVSPTAGAVQGMSIEGVF